MTTGNAFLIGKYPGTYQHIQRSNGALYFDTSTNITVKVGKSWSGSNDQGYRKKISQKVSATNPYTMETSWFYGKRAETYQYFNSNEFFSEAGAKCYGQAVLSTPNWDAAAISKNTNAAMSKMYDELARMRNATNGLEFLAEFRSTLKMVKHPAETLANYLNHKAEKLVAQKLKSESNKQRIWANRKISSKEKLRRLNREQARITRVISSTWLEIQFGAKPLLGMVSDVANAAIEVFPDKGTIKTISKTSKSKVAVTTTRRVGYQRFTYNEDIIEEYEYSVTLKARVAYDGRYDGMSALSKVGSRAGFQMSNVIPTAWELTPLSVFADYFVNVGSVLTALCTDVRNVVSIDRYVTRTLLRRTVVSFNKHPNGTIDSSRTRSGSTAYYYKNYTREKWVMSIPPITFTTPVDSWSKMANLSAFLRNSLLK